MNRILRRVLFSALFPLAFLLTAAANSQNALSPAEQQLASQIGFDPDVLLFVKEDSRCQLHRLSGYDADEYQIVAEGISISVPWNRSNQVLWSLRTKLKPRKYMAFVTEINYSLKSDKIAIIRGSDQFEILRIMHTNGDDDDVSHETVIATLQQWEKRSRFEIVGAENDWVEIEFRTMPQDLEAFALDVYEFSPDTVDEGTRSVDELIRDIRTTKRLVLWWE